MLGGLLILLKLDKRKRATYNIGFCASVAGQTNIGQLQIRAVVRAGQTTLAFSS